MNHRTMSGAFTAVLTLAAWLLVPAPAKADADQVVATLPRGSYQATPVGPFELFGRVGEYWYNYHNAFITPIGEHVSVSNSYHHLIYGGGIGLVVVQRVAVRLDTMS